MPKLPSQKKDQKKNQFSFFGSSITDPFKRFLKPKQPTQVPPPPLPSTPAQQFSDQFVQAPIGPTPLAPFAPPKQPIIPPKPPLKPSVLGQIGAVGEEKVPEAPKLPIEPPKLARDDFKTFYEGIAGVSEVEKAQKSFQAQREAEQKAFDVSQAQIGGLITKSQELFDNLFKSPEMVQAKADRGKAFTELQRIDAEEAEATSELRKAIRQKGTPSWAAAGQLRIVGEGYNGIRAKQLANFAIANDALEQGTVYAEQAYNHGVNILEAQIGLVENALKRATTLTEQERLNYQDTLTRAKEVYDAKKKDKDTAIATFVSLSSQGITGLSPDMSLDEMTRVAGPELAKIGIEKRELDKLDSLVKRASAAKSMAEVTKINNEIKQLAARQNAMMSENVIDVLRASAGGKDATDTFKTSFEKGVNVVFQIDDLQKSVKDEATGPIWGTIRSANPYDVKAQQIKAQLTAIVPNLARGIYGEVGVLTDNDIKTYSQTLPNIQSKEELIQALLGITVKSVQRSLETKLRVQAGAGVDVSGQEFVYKQVKDTADRLLGIAGGEGGEGTSADDAYLKSLGL